MPPPRRSLCPVWLPSLREGPRESRAKKAALSGACVNRPVVRNVRRQTIHARGAGMKRPFIGCGPLARSTGRKRHR